MADEPVAEYIPREQYERELSVVDEVLRPVPGSTHLPREVNRRTVVRNFLDAFEMIGGVPALAEWGRQEDNQGDFYKLYARMAPSASSDPQSSGGLKIIHVIPPSALDE